MTTTISGDTGVSNVQPGSIVQEDLAPNIAGNGPAFSAYQSAVQGGSVGAWTKVWLQTKEFDTSGAFDSAVNYTFTPNVAGYYHVTGRVGINGNPVSLYGGVYKSGVLHKQGATVNGTNAVVVSCLVYLNGTTDNISLGYYEATNNYPLVADSVSTYLQAHLARAA